MQGMATRSFPTPPESELGRWGLLDSLRGFAMVWMTVFHFCFDLANQGYIQQNFYADPFWTWQRTCILSLFLLCAGAGQAVATHQGQTWGRFWRRWLQIAACAALVTVGSMIMFPGSFIYFGVLHGMAVMLIVLRLTAGWGRWLWILGGLAIAMKFVAAYAISAGAMTTLFNEKWLNWLGMVSVLPVTEDYVPVLPWLGVMWWGAAAAGEMMRHSKLHPVKPLKPLKGLAWLGRWSLTYYMVHQPVMLGGLWAYAHWLPGG